MSTWRGSPCCTWAVCSRADSVPEQGQSVLGLVFDVVACVQDLPELEQVVLFDRLVAWRPGGLGCGPARGRVRWRRR